MALKQNCVLIAQMPLRHFGGAFAVERTMWGRSDLRNLNVGQGFVDRKVGIPDGYRHPASWLLPMQTGAIASRSLAEGTGSFTGAGALGRNATAALEGTATLDAIGQLIVSATATLAGSGALSGDVLAVLLLAANLAASGDATGAATALGNAIAALEGAGAVTDTLTASGTLAAAIDVASTGDALTAAQVSADLLDSQLVETGLTVRETLRICVAALAGKVSGASGTTITIRNTADTADRIVATVDSSGNRTAVTLDAG